MKNYARFTLFVTYQYRFAAKIGKPTQLHRADITRLKFHNDGVYLHELHDLAVLHKKMIALKHCIQTAIIYDNEARNINKQKEVYKCSIIVNTGAVEVTRNWLDEYYDVSTGKPYPQTPFEKALNEQKGNG